MSQQTTNFRLTAEAGRWTGSSLENLPEGTTLAVEAVSDGPFTLMLFDGPSFDAYPAGPGPLISNAGSGRVSFTVMVTRAGKHVLIADNREGTEDRAIAVTLTAFAPGTPSAEAMRQQADTMLAAISEGFDRVFRLPETEITATDCTDRVFAEGDGIVLCAGYVDRLLAATGAGRDASPVLMFSIFQKFAERVAPDRTTEAAEMDALATAMMTLLGYRGQAETVAALGDDAAALFAARGDDPRYGLDAARAAAVAAALHRPDLLSDWAADILAALETDALEKLETAPPDGLDPERVAEERARR